MIFELSHLLLLWGIITVIFGIMVIFFPKILNYLIGVYLIVVGLMAVIGIIISLI